MSVLSDYERFRFLWGAVDWESGSESPYTSAQTGTTLGTSAAAGAGVGVRRCVLHVDRTAAVVGADDAEFHIDFLNITGGDPDDTWTPTDYSTLEGFLDTYWSAVGAYVTDDYKLAGYHWYRYGPGVVAPNPAERVTARSAVGGSSSDSASPQTACSVTFRTAVRRSWGRTYLPLPALQAAAYDTNGRLASSLVDAICTAHADLYSAANGADFPQVVVSKHLSAVLSIEAIEVDNNEDVVRRRRWKQSSYKKIINT